ncbi:phosphodiester glycosidase family protein [Cohnella suwonensis]|uniref:Phosphodiester glycosidase family protein n=1 Tax=Cohnella suwonensis TaxID=696072 RepID=A0ABW0LVT6_9BACL
MIQSNNEGGARFEKKHRNRSARWLAVLLTVAVGWGTVGSDEIRLGSSVANAESAPTSTDKTEAEYWRFTAGGELYAPLALPGGKLFGVTSNGLIALLDGNGNPIVQKNVYTDLSAPALGADGHIWFAGKGARLYKYETDGTGIQAGIFYFNGKTEKSQSSAVVTDAGGVPYFAYENAVLSMAGNEKAKPAVLPAGTTVTGIAAAKDGAYALASNGTLYAVRGGAVAWQAQLPEALRAASLASAADGAAVLLADGAIAAYEPDGRVRFNAAIASAPAGGWTSPAVIGGDAQAQTVVAAERAGNVIAAFRLSDGTQQWRASAPAAGGFATAALAPDAAAGHVLAGAESGAVYAIDAGTGAIAYAYGGDAAVPASGVAPMGGGRIAYASAGKLIAAGPYRPVAVAYATASIELSLDKRLLLTDKLKLSVPVAVGYRSDNAAVVRVNEIGVVSPLKVGQANLTVEVEEAGYKGRLVIPVTVKPSAYSLKAKQETKKVAISGGKTFSVTTVSLPKGMPVTAALASRKVGVTQDFSAIAKAYNAENAINGTYFEAYGGIPEPYGSLIVDGKVEFIGNTGTTVGFTWDGQTLIDTLRVRILGSTDGLTDWEHNWYVYFVNRTPTPGISSAVMFTPARGAKIGFAYGSYVVVRKGVVTKVGKNENAAIPADGYVLVFAGSEEKLAQRFKVGTEVGYRTETVDLGGKPIPWSRVHTAVGAGPRLVKDGKLSVNPAAEGFTSPKILTNAAMRSGILVKKDGSVVIATVSGATIKQWAEIMLKLGAHQAMNLDGGASSGLFSQGKTIVPAGRLISNALVFGSNLKW